MASEIAKEQLGERLRDLVVEKLTEKAAQKKAVQNRAATSGKSRAKAQLQADAIEMLSDRISTLDMWTRVPPSGRRPRLSRDDLAATAVRLADGEGFAALSMRRLAAELDVGTMTLYHYVRTKDELLTVVMDEVMSEVVVPADEPIPTDWREALTLIAGRSRAAMERHPWILDINDDPPIGPNSVRHFDQSLQAVANLDAPLADKLDIVGLVDEYVFGYCLAKRNSVHADETSDEDDMVSYVSVLIETGAYPQLAALAGETGLRALWKDVWDSTRDESRFERNLARILDGVAADLARS
jgi:AcrR family transcriptional regulator